MSQTEAGDHGDENALGSARGNATSVTTQVKNEFNREAIPAWHSLFRGALCYVPGPYEQIQGTMTNGGVAELAEGGGLENVTEEIGSNVFNRLQRSWSGQFGTIRAAQNWATIWATH
jgi:hypothetical protein